MAIAIIGGGLSGTLLTYYLLENSTLPLTIYLFEKNESQLARGIAYRESIEQQLLNVPASRMDIYGSAPGSFYQWLCTKLDARPSPDDFVARAWFGTYLKELFERSQKASKNVTLQIITEEVTDIIKTGSILKIATGNIKTYEVSYAVLANGILPPADPLPLTDEIKLSSLYQSNPWNFQYRQQLVKHDHIVLLGTGLTMLDLTVNLLRDKRDFRITTISRRGLLPLPHRTYNEYHFPDYKIVPCEDINELFRFIRQYYNQHKERGLDWQCLIDRVRLQVPELWRALNDVSKARFLRHLKPFWEIHRHRAPKQVLDPIHKAINSGSLTVLKGRILQVERSSDQILNLSVLIAGKTLMLPTNYLLNSSGLQQNISLTSDTLLKNLIQRNYLIPDSNGLGAEIDDQGALTGKDVQRNIFTLGALRRAAVLESTAAKEIGEQAFALSQHILRQIPTD